MLDQSWLAALRQLPTVNPFELTPSVTPTVTLTVTLTPDLFFPQTAEAGMTVTPTPGPIPEPEQVQQITLPPNLRILLLAGQDRTTPFVGRTDALMLVFYDPMQARAGVISLPPDMLVSIPEFGAGRLNTAYALSGAQGLLKTITFNFGVTPDHYAIFNTDSFTKFIDDLGGIYLTIDDPLLSKCRTATPSPPRPVKGSEVLCIFKARSGPGEVDRNKRQAIVLNAIFKTLVSNGNLVRVPKLAENFNSSVDSNLEARDLVSLIPLTLQMGDVDRFKIYTVPEDGLEQWEFSINPGSYFLIPQPGLYTNLIYKVVEQVTSPLPYSTYLPTLQYMLLVSPTPTYTPKPTRTPTRTATPTRTKTPVPTKTVTVIVVTPGP